MKKNNLSPILLETNGRNQFTGSQESILQLDAEVEDGGDDREQSDNTAAAHISNSTLIIQMSGEVRTTRNICTNC